MIHPSTPTRHIRRLGVSLILACAVAAPHGQAADDSMAKAQASYEAGDYQQALEIWLLKAYEGDAQAQYRLGRMFAEGTGTVADLTEAVYWYTRSAEQGNAPAQYELGSAWFHGAGVDPDKTKAIQWWQVAAENGNAAAQYHLGRAYFYGIDLGQDSRLAMEWFTRAAGNGSQLAREFLQRVGVSGETDPTLAGGGSGYGRVGDRAIWVYASFNRLSPILRRLDAGALLRVVEHKNGWFRVQIPGGLPVWVPADKVESVDDGHRIVGVGVAARPDPDSDPDIKPVGMFLDGDRVVPIEEKDDWLQVQAPESISGWVEAIDVVELDADEAELERRWQAAQDANDMTPAAAAASRSTVVLPSSPTDESDAAASGDDDGETPVAATGDEPGAAVGDAAEGVAREIEPVEAPAGDAARSRALAGEVSEADDADAIAVDDRLDDVAGEDDPPGRDATATDDDRDEAPVDAADIAAGDYLRVGPQGQSIYARNRLSSARIDLMPADRLVRVVERRGDWVEVEVPGGLPLWIYSRFIEHDGDNGRITGRNVRARPLPSTSSSSQPVGTYPEGAKVRVIAESEQWVRIHAPQSLAGWMPIKGLRGVDADEASIAAQWRQQSAGGVAAFKTQAAGVESAAEQVTAENGAVDQAVDTATRVTDTVSESAAADVEAGRTASTGSDADEASADNETVLPADDVAGAPDADAEPAPTNDAADDPASPAGEDDDAAPADIARTDAEASNEAPLASIDEPTVAAPASEASAAQSPAPIAPVQDESADSANAVAAADVVSNVPPAANTASDSPPATQAIGVGGPSGWVTEDHSGPADEPGTPPPQPDAGSDPPVSAEEGVAGGDDAGDAVAMTRPQAPDGSHDAPATGVDTSADDATSAASTEPRASPAEAADAESTLTNDAVVSAGDGRESADALMTPPSVIDAPTAAASPTDTATGSAKPADADQSPSRVGFDNLSWLYQQSADAFTIEVLRAASREAVAEAGERMDAMHRVHAFSFRQDGEMVYSLMVGAFANLVEVKQALGELQDRFEAIRIRRLGAVQQQWCARLDNLTPEQLLLVVETCVGS